VILVFIHNKTTPLGYNDDRKNIYWNTTEVNLWIISFFFYVL